MVIKTYFVRVIRLQLRKDTWKEEDDAILAETVLHYISSGRTQLTAFEAAASRLDRTAAACGFRWNNEVRKRCKNEIKQAKEQRRLRKPTVRAGQTAEREKEDPMLVKQLEDLRSAVAKLERQLEEKDRMIEDLRQKLEQSRTQEDVLNEDYKNLIEILQRARQLGVLERIS
jgi:prespore-specific regulator